MGNSVWKASVSGNWTDAIRWSSGAAPTSADDVSIAAFTKVAYVVTIDSADVANSLTISAADAELLENAGSLAVDGALKLDAGNAVLNRANNLGSVAVNGGTLAVGAADALGQTGTVTLAGGELRGTKTETIADPIDLTASSTIAAAHGTTLTLQGKFSFAQNTPVALTIGAPGDDGVVVISNADESNPEFGPIDVRAGTAVGGFDAFSYASSTTVEAGATIDSDGSQLQIGGLRGAGAIVNPFGYQTTLTFLGATNFSGSIIGAFAIDAPQLDVTLGGLTRVTGGTTIDSPFTNTGTFDLPTDAGVGGYFPSSTFDNKGVFAKTGGSGTSVVSTIFHNEGAIVVNHGSISFHASTFVTSGAIRARVSSTSTTLTLSAATRLDLSDDGLSDILFRRSSDGVAYLYTMNGAAVTAGNALSTQVGQNWQIKGFGDFDGDGSSDILFVYANASNASDPLNGVSYISRQNGAASIAAGVVQQLASVWQVQGTGDFDGDGRADVLYRNTNSGSLYIDVMNGAYVTPASGFTSQQIANQNWRVAGTGDFNGDGDADILWRYDNAANAADPLNGVVYEWTMNGTSVAAQGLISAQPGSDKWTIAGTGDFNGDGNADILFRYENAANAADPLNGFTYIDIMNGTAVTSGAPTQWQIDNSWAIASIGDYNGDGRSDLLFQQASTGNTYIWTMNGANVTSGAFTSQQSGSGWSVQNGVLIG